MARIGRVLVTGSGGLVGGAVSRRLRQLDGAEVLAPPRSELDLQDRHAVEKYMSDMRPDTVVLAAAKVGGIEANRSHPVAFLVENLEIQNNVMTCAADAGVSTLMFLGSSCIYPRECRQPMRESDFMTGPLEPTNESYAVAKIAGIRLAQALQQEQGIRVVLPMPSNVYGPGDHFELDRSHVLSALVRRFEDARREKAESVTLWGSGGALREFLHVDDLAHACLFLLGVEDDLGIVNVGSGTEISIAELAEMTARLVGYDGRLEWDLSRPDGMPRKLMDVSRMKALGWEAQIGLESGIAGVVRDYRARYPQGVTFR